MSMAGLYEGAVASEERWERRRSEARAAFMEFMKMYPNASAEDYRSYVNSITDGSSYLRGGIPTDQVLNKLAADRQAQYAQEQLNSRIQTLSSQAQLAGQVDALAGRLVLDIDDDNKLVESLAGSLGYDSKNPSTAPILDLVRRQYPSGFGGLRNQVQQELFDKNLPTVMKIIEANPNLTDEQVLTLAPGLNPSSKGPQRNMLTQLLSAAREQYKATAEKAKRERIQAAVNDARTQIDTTGEYSLPSLSSDELQEAERMIQPYKKGYEQKVSDEKRRNALAAMSEYAKSATAIPGFAITLANDKRAAADFKDALRTVGSVGGYVPQESDLNQFLSFQNIAGRALGDEQDRNLLKDYESQLDKAASVQGARPDMLPYPPAIRNDDLRRQAADILKARQQAMVEAQQQADLKERTTAVDKATSAIVGDPELLDQIVRGDIAPNQITQIIADRIKSVYPKDATVEMLMTVQRGVEQRIEALKSSQVVKDQEALKAERKDDLDKASQVGREALAGVITANTQDSEGNPTPATEVLKLVAARIADDPDSQIKITPRVATILASYMSSAFVQDHKGDVNAMVQTILSKEGQNLRAASREVSSFDPRFPYGDRRGSKTLITKAMPDRAITGIASARQAAQEAYKALALAQQNDDPSTTRDTEDAINSFNAELRKAKSEAQRQAANAIQTLRAAKEKSRTWSSDGEITESEAAEVEARIAKDLRATLEEIAALNKRGTDIVMSLGVRPEDQVMRTSERIDEQRRSSWTPEQAEAAKEAAKGARDAGVGSSQLLRAIEDVGVDSVGQEWTDEEKRRIAKEQGLSDAMIKELLGK